MATYRRKFYPSDLEHSEDFYQDIAIRIFYAECYALGEADPEKMKAFPDVEFASDEERLTTKVNLGFDDFTPMIENVITINRCFTKLLKSIEPLGALALVRIQIDNLKHIYAETKYPTKVLHRIYEDGRELNQIKIDGKAINPTELIQELDEKHGRIRDIWKTYCQYVHPSKKQTEVKMRSYFSYMKLKQVPSPKAIKYFSWDMVFINMIISSTLCKRLDELIAIVKEKHNYRKYLESIKDYNKTK